MAHDKASQIVCLKGEANNTLYMATLFPKSNSSRPLLRLSILNIRIEEKKIHLQQCPYLKGSSNSSLSPRF